MVIVQFIGVNIQLYFNTKFLNLDLKYGLKHQLISILFSLLLGFYLYGSIQLYFYPGTIINHFFGVYHFFRPNNFSLPNFWLTRPEDEELGGLIFLRVKKLPI